MSTLVMSRIWGIPAGKRKRINPAPGEMPEHSADLAKGAALTHPIGLFADRVKLVQHRLGEDRRVAGVHHEDHAVDHVIQGGQLLIAWRVRHEGTRGTKLRSKRREGQQNAQNLHKKCGWWGLNRKPGSGPRCDH